MSKKLSPYARKKRREINNKEKLTEKIMDQMCGLSRVIARSQPFEGNPIYKPEPLLIPVRTTLQKLLDHTLDGTDLHALDHLVCAIGEAKIRYLDIGGGAEAAAMPILNLADDALLRVHTRWQSTGVYGLDGLGRQEIKDGIQVFEDVFLASSPNQMVEAENTYRQWIKLQKKGKLQGRQVLLKKETTV